MTEQNTELESLRAKNAELLTELKGVKAKLREAGEADTGTADQLKAVTAELVGLKTSELMESSWAKARIAPEMAKYAKLEIPFELSIDDDGEIVAIHKDTGQIVSNDDQTKALDPADVLYSAFEELRLFNKAFFGAFSGGGCVGDDGRSYPIRKKENKPAPVKTMGIGLR